MRGTDVKNITCYIWEMAMAKSQIEIFHFQNWHLANTDQTKLETNQKTGVIWFTDISDVCYDSARPRY